MFHQWNLACNWCYREECYSWGKSLSIYHPYGNVLVIKFTASLPSYGLASLSLWAINMLSKEQSAIAYRGQLRTEWNPCILCGGPCLSSSVLVTIRLPHKHNRSGWLVVKLLITKLWFISCMLDLHSLFCLLLI